MDLFQVTAVVYSKNDEVINTAKNALYHNGFTYVHNTSNPDELNHYIQNEPELFVVYDALEGYPEASEIEPLLNQQYGILGLLFFGGGIIPYLTKEGSLPKFVIKSVPFPLDKSELHQVLLSMLQTNNVSSFVMKHKINVLVTRFLKDVGVPPHLNGYHYLHEAMTSILLCPEHIRNLSQNVYLHIAEKNQTTTSCVERAMRNALKYARETTNCAILWSNDTLKYPRTVVSFLSIATSLIHSGSVQLTKQELYSDMNDFLIALKDSADENFWTSYKV